MRRASLAPSDASHDELAWPTRVARQPIFDQHLAVIGYELLHRPAPGLERPADLDAATSSVILTGLADIGLEQLAANRPAYINFSREFLLAVRPLPLPPDRVVIELLEDQLVDSALLEVLVELRDQGFRIALDDFFYAPTLEPLVELADVVKLDVRALGADALAAHVARLQGRGLCLLAEKVETRQELEHCHRLGFEAFQGYFFTRPALVRTHPVPTWQMGALRLAAAPDHSVSFEDIEHLLLQDAGLAHKLLRYANSAHLMSASRVSSIRSALMRIGTRTVRQWLAMIALAGGGDQPHELLLTALVRARLCQLLASAQPGADPDRAYTAGLLSVLDALLDDDLEGLVGQLPLDEPLKCALLEGAGPEGQLLRVAMAFERGEFSAAHDLAPEPQWLARHYRTAVAGADEAVRALQPAG